MEPTGVKRKLAVILAADAEGYTRVMGADEEATLNTFDACAYQILHSPQLSVASCSGRRHAYGDVTMTAAGRKPKVFCGGSSFWKGQPRREKSMTADADANQGISAYGNRKF